MKLTILILSAILLTSCCPETVTKSETIIKTDTVTVYKQGQTDTVTLNNWNGESIRYIVKVDTLLKRVFVHSKPETLKVTIRDTVTITNTMTKEKSFTDGITLKDVMIFVGSIALIGFIAQIFKR